MSHSHKAASKKKQQTSSPALPPMAAVASLPNPISLDAYLVFYNDMNQQLGVVQQFKSDLGQPLFNFNSQATPDVPTGEIANPSAISAVIFDSMINVYGVLNGTTKGDLLLCKVSPGFALLNIGDPPLATTNSIAACSDGKQTGSLFYLVETADRGYRIRVITLPGISTSQEIQFSLQFNPTSYLGAAYGSLPGQPADAYVAVQDIDGYIHVVSQHSGLSGQIEDGAGLQNTPIACLFIGTSLIIYFFSPASTSGISKLCRAITVDLNSFSFRTISEAPNPNGYTQLAAFSNPSSANAGLGSVILTYVQNGSNVLVSWQDSLSGFQEELAKVSEGGDDVELEDY
ncbi:hypothetical protein FN846DRAFT_911173 [Sphaerosporella brunnea]|uniref:Lactonase, 7-bladed beta-propeller-domain-containing protein n=1 Tax=Sphaerosporella brunnea TaxID=1250544 RepID=A0A5J5ELM9_9PEZI|nr:hypothetical protein FN846DRAFT_911173 [Sphaerosporella brunnea]